MGRMTVAQRDAFLAEPRIAVLTTLGADGAPTAVPVWFSWDGTLARVFTGRTSEKIGRLRADPRVCLTIAEPAGVTEAYVSIEGTAEVHDGGWALAQRLAPRYYDAAQSARALADWGKDPSQWVEIVITPTRIRSLAPS
jgi:PPOX class probable F420-dependent enzyme